jgi:methylmalonyl-CoA mutase
MSHTTPQIINGKLLAEFPPVSYDDWRKLVEIELKGALFDRKMFSTTSEGVKLHPIYRPADTANLAHIDSFPGFAPFVRGASASGYAGRPWAISQEINCASPFEFNHAARNSLSRGLNALNMVLDQATRNGYDPDWAQPEQLGRGGLSVATLGDLDRALEGIDLEKISLFIRSGASAMPFAALLIALARKRGKPLANLRGCIEMDPLGVLSHEGTLPQSLASAYDEMAALTSWAARHTPGLQTVCVHSRAWHEAGGHAVQELAFTLATGVEYLRELNQRGLDVNAVAPGMRFAVTTGVNFFMEIAKLRALRMLWSRAVGALGGDASAQALSLHVRTSQRNKTVNDPYNNLLRATVEAFAGVMGGCESMQVGAFDEVIRRPDDFGERLARNTQLILQKECSLENVLDPAGGSWFVETVTADLAARAWKLFQEVEKLGGMQAALRAGFPQQAVAAAAAEKIKAVSLRRQTIVGVNQYANPREQALEVPPADGDGFQKRRAQQITSYRTSFGDADNELVLEKLAKVFDLKGVELFEACIDAATAGGTLGEITRAIRIRDTASLPIAPVRLGRNAELFEELRATADLYAVRDGHRPFVFLCNMGPLREHKARADFARGFFAAGGFEVISPAGFKTPEDAVQALVESKTAIAVICSTDDKYPALVPPLVEGIRARAPKVMIALAGYPQDQVETYKKAGVDEFIHLRADAVELLARFLKKLGSV